MNTPMLNAIHFHISKVLSMLYSDMIVGEGIVEPEVYHVEHEIPQIFMDTVPLKYNIAKHIEEYISYNIVLENTRVVEDKDIEYLKKAIKVSGIRPRYSIWIKIGFSSKESPFCYKEWTLRI